MAKRKRKRNKNAAIRYNLFAHAYAKEPNATKAAITAGYKPHAAYAQGAKLLKIAQIQEQIAQLVAKRAQKFDISAERVLKEIATLGFANMQDYMSVGENGQPYVDLSKMTREQAAAIQEFSMDTTGGTGDGERLLIYRRRFKLVDKTKNLELLGKHLKLFVERVEVTGDADILAALAAGRDRVRSANSES